MLKGSCDKTYIGRTSCALKVRLGEHKSTIRCQDITSPGERHIEPWNKNHYFNELHCVGIEKVISIM
jgi:hypothetical protein